MTDAARLAELIAEDFYGRRLDFSARKAPGGDAWARLPEVEAVEQLRTCGAPERDVRLFLTFVAAMDRVRDATALWRAARGLFRTNPEIFDPIVVSSMSYGTLGKLLRESRVSKMRGPDTRAWRTIAANLAAGDSPVCRVIGAGEGDAGEMLRDVRSCDRRGRARFPLLRGDKISLMWVRMMAEPGKARIRRLETVPVAVDVQVRRVTENLGVTDTRGPELNNRIKKKIQDAWSNAVANAQIGGPERIAGTCAALDPALWFYAKHGCSHCERVKRRVRFGRACDFCRLPVSKPSGQRGTALLQVVRHLLRWRFADFARRWRAMPAGGRRSKPSPRCLAIGGTRLRGPPGRGAGVNTGGP